MGKYRNAKTILRRAEERARRVKRQRRPGFECRVLSVSIPIRGGAKLGPACRVGRHQRENAGVAVTEERATHRVRSRLAGGLDCRCAAPDGHHRRLEPARDGRRAALVEGAVTQYHPEDLLPPQGGGTRTARTSRPSTGIERVSPAPRTWRAAAGAAFNPRTDKVRPI